MAKSLTDQQRQVLATVEKLAMAYEQHHHQAEALRAQLVVAIKEAKNLGLTTYEISPYARLSQPRISQITRGT